QQRCSGFHRVDVAVAVERATQRNAMNRPGTQDSASPDRASDLERAEAASLASKLAALPHQLDPAMAHAVKPSSLASPIATRKSRLFGRIIDWLAWIVTLSLAVLAGLRIFDHDALHLLIWLNAFSRYV